MKVTKLQAQMLVLFLVSMFLAQNVLLPVLTKTQMRMTVMSYYNAIAELLSDDQEKLES